VAGPITMLFGMLTQEGSKNHAFDTSPDPPCKGGILRGGGGVAHCNIIGTLCRELCKMAEPNKMPFRIWTRVGPRNHVLDGGPDSHA